MKICSTLILASSIALAACDKPEPPDLVQPQRQALEKAQGVEQTLQQGADDRAAAIEQAEGK